MDKWEKEVTEKIMLNPKLYEKAREIVNEKFAFMFWIAKEEGLSIDEWKTDVSFNKQIGQKTVFLTVRMFDTWEYAIQKSAKILLIEEEINNVKVYLGFDSTSDIIFKKNKEKFKWEVKTSMGLNSFTGATHSSSKSPNFILINFRIDKTKKIATQEDYITDMFAAVWTGLNRSAWIGKHTNKNSFTTLKLPVKGYNATNFISEGQYNVIVGSPGFGKATKEGKIKPNRKWIEFVSKKYLTK